MTACVKESNIKGSYRYKSDDYKLKFDLVAPRRVNMKKLITGMVKLESVEDASKKVKVGKGIKILTAGIEE